MITILLILYNFTANLSNDIYLPSMPKLESVFGVDSNMLQLTMTVWFAGVALPQLLFGPLTDKYGRRPIIIYGGICFLIATLMCMAATNIYLLIFARFLQGVGVCSLNVATYTILVDLYDYKKRTLIMNKISAFCTLAPLIGPVIGGYILIYLGWRFNFTFVFVLGGLSIIGLYFKLPESNNYLNPNALNVRNMSKSYLLLIKTPGFLRYLMVYCLLLGGLIAYLTAAPFILITKLQLHPEHFGYTQIPVFGAYVLGSLCLSRAKDENKIKALLKLGIIIVFGGSVSLLSTSLIFGTELYFFIASITIYSFGLSLCSSPLINEIMSSAVIAKGSASAFLGFGMAVSCALSSMAVSLVYNGTSASLGILLVIIVSSALLRYFIDPQRQQILVTSNPEPIQPSIES